MFEGPFFIVGRGRSGTKLLRQLLNQHSGISIPVWESDIIPHYAEKAKLLGDFHHKKNLEEMIEALTKTVFYRKMTSDQGYPQINKSLWLSSVTDFSYPGIIAALYKLYASFEGKYIWGDKSATHMVHMPLLKELFPQAKFIHIIRDVRDVCLSLRNSWGFHPLRGAQQWHDHIVRCRDDARRCLAGDYLEIRYESLLQETRSVLMQVCTFLNVNFEDSMTTLQRSTRERFGDARDATHIVSTNREKWRDQLTPHLIKRIEEISFNVMQEVGYPVLYAERQTRLTSSHLLLLRAGDAWHRFKVDYRVEGSMTGALVREYRRRRFG